MAIQIGDVVGDYRVTGVLGRGGMGKVYRVRSLLTDREEAMKVVLDDDPALADRFLREIRVHASLQHPNIAALRTAMRIENRVIMIVELVDGVSLDLRQAAMKEASSSSRTDRTTKFCDWVVRAIPSPCSSTAFANFSSVAEEMSPSVSGIWTT